MTNTRTFEPFPEGEQPDGWPREYVSLADYHSAVQEIDRLKQWVRWYDDLLTTIREKVAQTSPLEPSTKEPT